MTRDVLGDELPDWVGAKEFHQKYEPKEVIGRWVMKTSSELQLKDFFGFFKKVFY